MTASAFHPILPRHPAAEEEADLHLVDALLADAPSEGITDVHVESTEAGLTIRVRVAGMLVERLRSATPGGPAILRRFKMMARLDPADHVHAQVGRVAFAGGGKLLDLQVATLPVAAGERMTLSLLDTRQGIAELEAAGMPAEMAGVLEDALNERNGLVLLAGPRSSGKSTTFHAALHSLHKGRRNIMSVEEVLTRSIDGVGQTLADGANGLTAASTLRAVLDHDPDGIGLDEISDVDAAQIAIEAARNDHLVLGTIEAKDAVGAIARLRAMKIEPFMMACALCLVVSQRLVQRICGDCREHIQAGKPAALLGLDPGTRVYRGKGCASCAGSGYAGRTGVFEAIRIDDGLRRMIYFGGDDPVIASHAYRNAPNLAASARALVLQGITTIEEAVRIGRTARDDA